MVCWPSHKPSYCINVWLELSLNKYFGTYHSFSTASSKDAADLIGADNIVGDTYRIDIEIIDGIHKAWLVNRFEKKVGYFDPDFSRELSVLRAQDMDLIALLSFVAFTEEEGQGRYWGEMAVIGYNPNDRDAFIEFSHKVAEKLGDGIRPDLNIGEQGIREIIDNNGNWLPSKRIPAMEKKKGTAVIKQRRSLMDKTVELGRSGNKGCYIVSWAFLLIIVALIIFGLKSCI